MQLARRSGRRTNLRSPRFHAVCIGRGPLRRQLAYNGRFMAVLAVLARGCLLSVGLCNGALR
jgi:hypothetical protein